MATGGESKLDCSICLSAFRSPKILPCFHTFCLQCLEEYVVRNEKDGKFECPLCRYCTDIPAGGVKCFQSNFYILGGNTPGQDIYCEVCGEGNKATYYCTDCEENFCERCSTFHTKMKMSREHTLLQLKDGNYTRKIQKKYFCPHHKGEEVKMVCKDCDTMLCVVCKLTEHENHNTSSITKVAEERRGSLLRSIVSANRHVKALKSRMSKISAYEKYMEQELDTSIVLLEKQVESVIAKIKKDADNMKQELINSYTRAKDYYTEKRTLIQSKLFEGEAFANHVQNVADFGDDNQVLDLKLVSKYQSLALTEECLIKYHEHLIFEANTSEVKVDILGKVAEVSSHVNVTEIDELHSSVGSTEANTLSLNAGRLYAAFTNFNEFLYHKTETLESNYTHELYEYGSCAGTTCIDGDLYFTSLTDKTLYIFNTQADLAERSKTKFLTFEDYPHGIAHRPSREGDNGQELLICCLKSSKLLEKNASEGCIMAASLKTKKQYTWRNKETPAPTCIATNTLLETVCLGYPAANKVTLNASDGTVLSVFSGEGCHGNPEKFCPVSVCFDSQFGIIIADYSNGSVIRIDEVSNFLQCLVQKKTPLSVLLGEGKILYVGFYGKRITRYQLV